MGRHWLPRTVISIAASVAIAAAGYLALRRPASVSVTGATNVIGASGVSAGGTRFADAEFRYAGAVESKRAEDQRIRTAQSAFSSDRITAPSLKRDYLVSFARPVTADDLFDGLSKVSDADLQVVFAWLQSSPSSTHISIGEHSATGLGWTRSNVASAAQKIRDFYSGYLGSQASSMEKTGPQGSTQASDTRQVNQQFSSSGVELFGMLCTCSPNALDGLASVVPNLELRAVEAAGTYQQPVPLNDPVRDLIIATGGRYGR
jgi:hypothetical protein